MPLCCWTLPRSIQRFSSLLTLTLLLGMGSASVLSQPASKSHGASGSKLTKTIRSLQQSGQRWIEVDLSHQRLTAWDGPKPRYAILVSTGKTAHPTQTGVFAIQSRLRYARMRGEDYDVANVPYTLYYSGNYAIHGAYWHHRFGTPVSHGCVNVAVNHARWLFNWSTIGTPVVVHE